MNLFGEIVTPPAHLPVMVTEAQAALAAAVVEECERTFSLAGHCSGPQSRKVVIDGAFTCAYRDLSQSSAITSFTRWTPTDRRRRDRRGQLLTLVVSSDPTGTIIVFTRSGEKAGPPQNAQSAQFRAVLLKRAGSVDS